MKQNGKTKTKVAQEADQKESGCKADTITVVYAPGEVERKVFDIIADDVLTYMRQIVDCFEQLQEHGAVSKLPLEFMEYSEEEDEYTTSPEQLVRRFREIVDRCESSLIDLREAMISRS